MKAGWLLPLSAAFGVACSQPLAQSQSESDGGLAFESTSYSISGIAQVEPAAAAWMADAGLPLPNLSGLTLRVQDPLLSALGDPHGSFGQQVLPASGTFSFPPISDEDTVSGVEAAFVDSADAGWIASTSVLYDNARLGLKPRSDLISMHAYALPTLFHNRLSDAVGSLRLSSLAGASSLEEAGFELFRVVDAQGNTVSGVQLTLHPGDTGTVSDDQLFYPSQDLYTVTAADVGVTSSSGLAVVVNGSSDSALPTQFSVTVTGHPEYPAHSAVLQRGSGQVVEVRPNPKYSSP